MLSKISIIILSLFLLFTFSVLAETPDIMQILTGGQIIDQNAESTVPFEAIEAINDIVVNVKLNSNDEEFRFIFDTGAGVTTINKSLADKLGLDKIAEVSAGDGFQSQNISLVSLDSIVLGNTGVKDCGAAIFDLDNVFDSIDGILGSNFLKNFIVKIDYQSKLISLYTKSDLIKTSNYDYHLRLDKDQTGLISTPLTFEGLEKPIFCGIDTGDSKDIYLNIPTGYLSQFKQNLSSPLIESEGVTHGGLFGESKSLIGRLKHVQFGNLQLSNLLVDFDDSDLSFGTIGNSFLSNFKVIIDYPKNYMYLKNVKGKKLKTNIYDFGFSLQKVEDSSLQIVSLWPGSSAKKSGLNIGDKIIKVTTRDGKRVPLDKSEIKKHDLLYLLVKQGTKEKKIIIKKQFLLPKLIISSQ
ncbi:hypothetical protein GM661_09365 [Iocasia frigidifontis]|uniref:PDZ domain-containing protein n=1 Tax=Iocasia fonsfrigidae TaxID=2682810 RepID=A0A8A7KJY0_9FIRM|nr:aspartyl protease family protein [Iocasia fonsfrigidae]QTL98172.1 hypothetical protein GM661_09365 [Iocasia fonsfrigidae]